MGELEPQTFQGATDLGSGTGMCLGYFFGIESRVFSACMLEHFIPIVLTVEQPALVLAFDAILVSGGGPPRTWCPDQSRAESVRRGSEDEEEERVGLGSKTIEVASIRIDS